MQQTVSCVWTMSKRLMILMSNVRVSCPALPMPWVAKSSTPTPQKLMATACAHPVSRKHGAELKDNLKQMRKSRQPTEHQTASPPGFGGDEVLAGGLKAGGPRGAELAAEDLVEAAISRLAKAAARIAVGDHLNDAALVRRRQHPVWSEVQRQPRLAQRILQQPHLLQHYT